MSYDEAIYVEADLSPIAINFIGKVMAFFAGIATIIAIGVLVKWFIL